MDKICVATVALTALIVVPAYGQTQPPPKTYTGSFGAGFALTGGNTETSTFNLGFNLVRDPHVRNVMKFDGLYLRADKEDETISDRLRLAFRDEFTLSNRTFLYGDFSYLRDPFKEISYLMNPQGGIGYKLYTTDRATLALSGGAGAVWEKNPGRDVAAAGTINAGQSLTVKLSGSASLNQVVSGLWKTEDFEDALYHFGIALVTSVTKRAELKVEFLDDFKNVTPGPAVKKNDTAFITSFLFKF